MQEQSPKTSPAAAIDSVEPLAPISAPTLGERPIMVLVSPSSPRTYTQRACTIWPRIPRRTLSRCQNDPARLARVIAKRTTLSQEAIVTLLTEDRD